MFVPEINWSFILETMLLSQELIPDVEVPETLDDWDMRCGRSPEVRVFSVHTLKEKNGDIISVRTLNQKNGECKDITRIPYLFHESVPLIYKSVPSVSGLWP